MSLYVLLIEPAIDMDPITRMVGVAVIHLPASHPSLCLAELLAS